MGKNDIETYNEFMGYVIKRFIEIFGYERVEPIIDDLLQEMRIEIYVNDENLTLNRIRYVANQFFNKWTCHIQGSKKQGIWGGNVYLSRLGDNSVVDNILIKATNTAPITIDTIIKHKHIRAMNDLAISETTNYKRGVESPNSKCDIKKIQEIRGLNKKTGIGCKKLGKMYGLHHSTIQRIINRETYATV